MLQSASLRETVAALVPVLSWVVFGAGVWLAWRFNRSALALALLVLFAAERALAAGAPGAGAAAGTGRVVATAAALLVPLNLAALAWVSARSILSPAGRWVLGALLAEPLAVALLCRPELAHVARALERGAVETSAVALALVLARFAVLRTIVHSSLAWAVVAAFLAMRSGGAAATVYFATGGLVLVVSLVETSHRMAYGDELTGLPGRRALDEALLRLGGQYAIAMVDIDHFKRFNDQYGHDAGDQLLRMVGGQLTRIDGGGRPFRYGGEEFAVLFPGKSADEALPHLERFRKMIARSSFTLRGRDRPAKRPTHAVPAADERKRISVTVSIGVAEPERDRAAPEEVIRAADAALYRAKDAGRNRVYRAG
ncbi:MAG: GGDEF domain-containing protein [Candidatus Rokubacteria bacterium]|nr:GGDEF domain-containing protein [Candidatus Rokubacteria bacterium]